MFCAREGARGRKLGSNSNYAFAHSFDGARHGRTIIRGRVSIQTEELVSNPFSPISAVHGQTIACFVNLERKTLCIARVVPVLVKKAFGFKARARWLERAETNVACQHSVLPSHVALTQPHGHRSLVPSTPSTIERTKVMLFALKERGPQALCRVHRRRGCFRHRLAGPRRRGSGCRRGYLSRRRCPRASTSDEQGQGERLSKVHGGSLFESLSGRCPEHRCRS